MKTKSVDGVGLKSLKLCKQLLLALLAAVPVAALPGLVALPAFAIDLGHKTDDYRQINLVSDQPGKALIQDTNLVNAWGISFSPTSTFWINDNETGRATLYAVTNDASGFPVVVKQGLEVHIPGEGNPTGQLFNNTTNFHGDVFIFVSEDGVISGWRGALGTNAEVLTARSNAVYKGVGLASTAGGPLLLAANFSEGTVDVYDGNLGLIHQLSNPYAPAGYAPFNIRVLDGLIFVTFAKHEPGEDDDEPGTGHGLIALLDLHTQKFHTFAAGSDAGGHLRELNSPWGLAIAPKSFGRHADQLLVGNFGSGTIMTFDDHGHFRGLLEDESEQPIVIDGLWGLTFGNGTRAGVPGTLYFTAGPNGEGNGLFGSLEPVPEHDERDHRNLHRH